MPEEAEIFHEILLRSFVEFYLYIHIFKKLDIREYKELLKDRTMPLNYRTLSNSFSVLTKELSETTLALCSYLNVMGEQQSSSLSIMLRIKHQ